MSDFFKFMLECAKDGFLFLLKIAFIIIVAAIILELLFIALGERIFMVSLLAVSLFILSILIGLIKRI